MGNGLFTLQSERAPLPLPLPPPPTPSCSYQLNAPPPLSLPSSQQGLVNDTAFYAVSGALFGGCVGAVKVRPRRSSSHPSSLTPPPPPHPLQAAWGGAPRAAVPLSQAITSAGRAVGSSAVTFAAIAGAYKAVASITEGVRGRAVRRQLHLSLVAHAPTPYPYPAGCVEWSCGRFGCGRCYRRQDAARRRGRGRWDLLRGSQCNY